jgi:anti-sigma regulatory factor (Ser/Thr protein kinase)
VLDGRTVIRGGVGLFYDKIDLNVATFPQLQDWLKNLFVRVGYQQREGRREYVLNPIESELLVPCDLSTFSPLQKLLAALETDVPPAIAEAINYAFSEMLSNAIEHGCKLDRAKRVAVSILRLEHAVICRIKDPGEGFDPDQLECAAINNPIDDPLHHVSVREKEGLRAGGFGILMTKQLVDDLVYNERHNELMFVKFLPDPG